MRLKRLFLNTPGAIAFWVIASNTTWAESEIVEFNGPVTTEEVLEAFTGEVNEAIMIVATGDRLDQAKTGTERAVATSQKANVSTPDDGNWIWVPTKVNFALNSSEFLSSRHGHVETIGLAMQADPTLVLAVSGHADARGSHSVNDPLSYKRAKAVKDYLVRSFGISEDRLVLRWRGEREPLPGTEATDPENRRVQFGKRKSEAIAEEREESDTNAVADLLRLLRDEGNAGN